MTDELETSAERPDTPLALIVRRWTLVALCALVGAVLAAVLGQFQAPEYRASASVLQRDSDLSSALSLSGDPQQASRSTMTATELVRLSVITDRAARQVGGGVTADQIAASVSVASTQDSDLLSIVAVANNPERAAAIANAVAAAYANFRSERVASQLEGARRRLEQRLEALSPTQEQGVVGSALRDQIARLDVASALTGRQIDVIQPAIVPGAPSGPDRKRVAVLGLLLGGLLGSGLAYFLGRLDRNVRSPHDLGTLLDAPVLAVLRQHPVYANGSGKLRSRDLEPFRLLWTRLRLGNPQQASQVVLVTSAAAGDGKTTIAWHLALTAAQLGDRTLLVEADVLTPSLAKRFKLAPQPGFAGVLAGEVSLDDAIQTATADANVGTRPFDVLVAGTEVSEEARIADMADELREISAGYDLVVIDSSSMLASADTLRLARQVDGIIFVGWLGRVERESVQFLKDDLRRLKIPLLGVVANAESGDPLHVTSVS